MTWLNASPLDMAGLGAKVFLVNFCTFGCIKWLRTFVSQIEG